MPCWEDIAMGNAGRNRPGPGPEEPRPAQSRRVEGPGMVALLTLPLRVPVEAVQARPRRAETVARGNLSETYEVKGKMLCRVPVAQDVHDCACGGVLSQRLNESLFCRTCGRDGSV